MYNYVKFVPFMVYQLSAFHSSYLAASSAMTAIKDNGDKVIMAASDSLKVPVFDSCFDCMAAVGQALPGTGWADACRRPGLVGWATHYSVTVTHQFYQS